MSREPAYLTKEGLEKAKTELAELKKKKREVAERINRAKELGDLSENAEYQDAKEEMAFVEGRAIELEDTINRAVLIEQKSGDRVTIGCTVTLKIGDREKSYTIVGANEADPPSGKISNETPLAAALLGKMVGDIIEVTVPSGKASYTIVKIS